jgi:uncharacterized phage-associated protein
MPIYSAKAIANEFLRLASEEGLPLTQMKLQKLVYISHGFKLALLDEALISDPVQAWQYGPVIPTLYEEFKGFGSSNITQPATDIVIDEESFEHTFVPVEINHNDNETRQLIQTVWEKYKAFSGPNLSDLTHRQGTPWSETYLPGMFHNTIPNETIKNYYNNLLGN